MARICSREYLSTRSGCFSVMCRSTLVTRSSSVSAVQVRSRLVADTIDCDELDHRPVVLGQATERHLDRRVGLAELRDAALELLAAPLGIDELGREHRRRGLGRFTARLDRLGRLGRGERRLLELDEPIAPGLELARDVGEIGRASCRERV